MKSLTPPLSNEEGAFKCSPPQGESEGAIPTIRLRAMEPEDLDLLYRIENDTRLWNVGATNVPYSRYALHDYIAQSTGDIYTDRQVRLMVENADGCVVGIVDIVNFDPRHLRAEVGIVIENGQRRHHYALAALRSIADYSLQVLHLHQLYVFVDAVNTASINLFRKVGFEGEHCLKDWLFDGNDYHDAILMQLFLRNV